LVKKKPPDGGVAQWLGPSIFSWRTFPELIYG